MSEIMSANFTLHHGMIALFFWFVAFLLALVIMRLHFAFFFSFIKIAISFTYFSFFFDGQWTRLDDWTYLKHGQLMLENGFTPVSALTSDGRAALRSLVGGYHILYTYWNFLSVYLFGEFYFSPVYMNVMLSSASSIILYKFILDTGFKRQYALFSAIFFLFHWDVLTWISFVNLKSSLVIFLELLSLFLILRLFKRRKIGYFLTLIFVCVLLLRLRLYIPLAMMTSVSFWVALGNRKKLLKYIPIFSGVFIVLGSLFNFQSASRHLNLVDIPFGTIRMLLTPLPWSIDYSYRFLLVSSIFHCLLFIPTVFGLYSIWKHSHEAKLLIIFSCFMILLYGAVPVLQGPRHRLQIVYMFSWGISHFVWLLIKRRRQFPTFFSQTEDVVPLKTVHIQ